MPLARACKLHPSAIQNWLVKAILASTGSVSTNHTTPGCKRQLHLDIVMVDKKNKHVVMVNITIPFKNWQQVFMEACKWRSTSHGQRLRTQECEVIVKVLIIGVLRT